MALSLGADVAIDPEPEGLTERLIEANGGREVDVVFDMAGGETFERSYRALAHFGRIVVCGISSQRAKRGVAQARCCVTRARSRASTCSTAWSARRWSLTRSPICSREPRAASCVSVVGGIYALEDAARAQIDLRERHDHRQAAARSLALA